MLQITVANIRTYLLRPLPIHCLKSHCLKSVTTDFKQCDHSRHNATTPVTLLKVCNLHLNIFLDNGVMTAPKRRIFSFIFTVLTLKKSLSIRILKRDNQLHLFRRHEQCSKKQIKCNGSIEFLRLCQNFDLTPTFAKVDKERSSTWKQSSATFERNVISEELKEKIKQSESLKCEINSIYDEIRQSCNLFRYTCILRTMVNLRNKCYQEVVSTHTKKIARLLYKETDVDEHIHNISSYELSFFQKLVLCRGLKFAFPQRVSPIEVKTNFVKAYWNLEPHLESGDLKELAASTLRSVALKYIQRKVQKLPKTLLLAIEQLKRRDDVVITKPDKGSGVVVMDKSEYLRLLSEVSINDSSKFQAVPLERPSSKGRPPT